LASFGESQNRVIFFAPAQGNLFCPTAPNFQWVFKTILPNSKSKASLTWFKATANHVLGVGCNGYVGLG
jgi:hypothetical protein